MPRTGFVPPNSTISALDHCKAWELRELDLFGSNMAFSMSNMCFPKSVFPHLGFVFISCAATHIQNEQMLSWLASCVCLTAGQDSWVLGRAQPPRPHGPHGGRWRWAYLHGLVFSGSGCWTLELQRLIRFTCDLLRCATSLPNTQSLGQGGGGSHNEGNLCTGRVSHNSPELSLWSIFPSKR